jgi:RHS repeat-associated protein
LGHFAPFAFLTKRQRLTNQITDGSGNVRTEQYGYDSLNRLVSVNYGDGETQSYTFDAMVNRLTKQDNVSGAENYGYNNANMLVSRNGSGYVNDLDGNTLSGGGRSNVWDSQNRLVSCNYTAPNGVAYSSQFTYGADGLRRRSMVTSNGVTNVTDTVYDASMPVEEVGYAQGTNTPYVSAMYLIGPRGPEYRRDVVHQSVSWYVYDGLGSVVEEVDPSGNITAARKYDVYGMVRSGQSGSSSQKYVGSLGHESDANTGLIYMRARYMDPVLGRFISEDPSEDGVNWFVYCGDEPVNHTDKTGCISSSQWWRAEFWYALGWITILAILFAPSRVSKVFTKSGNITAAFLAAVGGLTGFAMYCFGEAALGLVDDNTSAMLTHCGGPSAISGLVAACRILAKPMDAFLKSLDSALRYTFLTAYVLGTVYEAIETGGALASVGVDS